MGKSSKRYFILTKMLLPELVTSSILTTNACPKMNPEAPVEIPGFVFNRKTTRSLPSITFDELDIVGDMKRGKYYCTMCKKFFEFFLQRDTITCPLMAQKCMATPRNIEHSKYSLMDLMVVYEHTPDIYRRFIATLSDRENALPFLTNILQEEWGFTIEDEPPWVRTETIGVGGLNSPF